ncbi:hypothetical protein MYX75_00100 [Acidobacteria bacterium AH-259-A15]|nr:hypothetical protein [Acidobacteria bacterium AH-259-A15]
MIWAHELKNNPYYQQPRILDWCLAGVNYWTQIQKNDGSFDEWYPNERGWAGPTGYLVHAMADTYFRLGKVFPEEMQPGFRECTLKAGKYLVRRDEEYVLANHHAIALLAIYEAYLITEDEELLQGFHIRFREFLRYCYDEGYCLEYDGADLGYLSGTISFLSRLHHLWPDQELETVIERAIEFTSYFLYPDGFYGGTIGSRETVHFYHFGYEYWAEKIPLAAKMAETALLFLHEGKLVFPGTQEDPYVLYRVPEFIEAYLTWKKRADELPLLPFEVASLEKYYPKAGMFIRKRNNRYLVVSLKRGGVVKYFDTVNRRLIYNDCGWLGLLANGKRITSQWNDSNHKIRVSRDELIVEGYGHYVVTKVFTPMTMVLFRLFMVALGWHSTLAFKIKGLIRHLLMVDIRKAPVFFKRRIRIDHDKLYIEDKLMLRKRIEMQKLIFGGESNVRYVPQSRYFQLFELEVDSRTMSQEQLTELNQTGELVVSVNVDSSNER